MAPHLLANGGGRGIGAAVCCRAAAGKGGGLARELASQGVRVNGVRPGLTDAVIHPILGVSGGR